MRKSYFITILFCAAVIKALPQSSTPAANSASAYHSPSLDKPSWQRLNLLSAATFWRVVKEGQLDFDSCLVYASRSMGLSRLLLMAEGIDDAALLAQSSWVDRFDPGKGHHILSQSTGKKRLQALLLLGAYYAFEPVSRYNKDSVEYFLTKVIDESRSLKENKLRRQALCLLGKMFFEINDTPRGDSVFKRLTAECEEAGDKSTAARAYEYWGNYPPFSAATVKDRVNYFQKAADIYQQLNMPEGVINALTDMGYLLVTIGQLDESHRLFLQAFQLEETIGFPYTHYNTDILAFITIAKGNFGEPFRYVLQTIKTAESSRDSLGWGCFYERLSKMYDSEGAKEKESQHWAQKALDRHIQDGNPALYNTLQERVFQMNEDGQSKEALELITTISKKIPPVTFTEWHYFHAILANCHIYLQQFKLAEMHLAKADSFETQAEKFRGPLRRAFIYSRYGFLYYRQGEYRKARTYFEKSLTTTHTGTVSLTVDVFALRQLIKLDSIFNDPVSSAKHYRAYSQLMDSTFMVTKLRQAEELQVVYQTQEKENQIASLHQKAELEKANLKQATLVKNLTIAGIVAVLIIAGLLYRQNRLRKKTNNVITQQNAQLQHFLAEKEWLLKEIHHRVKNNLQIVMSLLNSQSTYIDNKPALAAIHDSQHRIHAMSLIHQKLYNTDNVSSIDMSLYVRELATYLADSFSTGQRIRFEFAVERVEIDVSQAIPLGLILNEAITNSIKYAFPGNRSGVISISLSNTSPNHYLLVISDNGIGMPAGFTGNKHGSLGMSLMEGLSEDLDGHFSIESNNGTTVKIAFLYNLGVKRPDSLTVSSLVSSN